MMRSHLTPSSATVEAFYAYSCSTMSDTAQTDWQLVPAEPMSADWVESVAQTTGLMHPNRGAQILWNRGIRTKEELVGFLNPEAYAPASPFAFGEEMEIAVARLITAREKREKVAIWGDFDADGVTSTAVLWDGLSQFFTEPDQLSYFIPNRLKESHGLSLMGVEQLAAEGINLIVTCDTGSTNPVEIERANALGIEVIVTDHHTLPEHRPNVAAIVNPRALPREHAMADLSGVAVAFKLVEAMYERLPEVPSRPLYELLDLVAIGLIADLVELRGDCRYLAQKGIEQLKTHVKAANPTRPGVAKLLKLCRRAGDRPTDISFGIGPRINAVSRIYGEASFVVELLTSRDVERCQILAEKAELANTRRKALQNDVLQQVKNRLDASDLSTLNVIVLCDAQWPVGVLGLVAGQVAQQYGRPTILLTKDEPGASDRENETLARGSARSVNGIDLYELVNAQSHMLSGFGGHPFAAGLSLPVDNLPMFTAAINQQYRQQMGGRQSLPTITADLTVAVSELGSDLFKELSLLEPCGMGNPAPKLLIQNCWFEGAWHQNPKDRVGKTVRYIKTTFFLCDASTKENPKLRFPGLWWGHYKDELPSGKCDVIVELDYNSHPKSCRYEVRLVDVRPSLERAEMVRTTPYERWLLDRRITKDTKQLNLEVEKTNLVLEECPKEWRTLSLWQHQSQQTHQPVALAYASPEDANPTQKWKTLLGIAKYLSKAQKAVTVERLCEKVEISDRTLLIGLNALTEAGFEVSRSALDIRFHYPSNSAICDSLDAQSLSRFLIAVQEEQFRRRYFYKAPVATLESALIESASNTK